MEKFAVKYIFDHYSRFMTLKEVAAWKHYNTSFKFEDALKDDPTQRKEKMFLKRGWLSNDPEILKLLENGIENFQQSIAERIVKEHELEIFFNNCKTCGRLARTPFAKQCRYCGLDWH